MTRISSSYSSRIAGLHVWRPYGGIAAVAGAAVLVSTAGIARRLGPSDLSPVTVAAGRLVVSGLFLFVGAWIGGGAIWRYRFRPVLTITGAFCLIWSQVAFFAAVDRVGVGVATLMTVISGPLCAGLYDGLGKRQLPTRIWLLGLTLSFVGLVPLSISGEVTIDFVGLVIAGSSGGSFFIYGLVTEQLITERSSLTVTATIMVVAAVILVAVLMVFRPAAFVDVGAPVPTLLLFLYLGIFTTALAYWLWAYGLEQTDLRDAMSVILVEPVAAFVLAITLVGESFTFRQAGGAAIMAVGLFLILRPNKKEPASGSEVGDRKMLPADKS